MLPKFEQFIRERQYLHNVSPATVSWHTHNLKWSGSPLKIQQMKEPQVVLPTYSTKQLQLILGWKPRNLTGHRLSTLIALLADTGCRIDEALSLSWKDIDLSFFFFLNWRLTINS